MATLIETDNSSIQVDPPNGARFSTADLEYELGGPVMMLPVAHQDGLYLVCQSLAHGEPVNFIAGLLIRNTVAGRAMLCRSEEIEL